MDRVYKYEATVSENGVIRIPQVMELAHQRIEILIRPLPSHKPSRLAQAFVERWGGLLKGFDPDELKSQYMQEKYG